VHQHVLVLPHRQGREVVLHRCGLENRDRLAAALPQAVGQQPVAGGPRGRWQGRQTLELGPQVGEDADPDEPVRVVEVRGRAAVPDRAFEQWQQVLRRRMERAGLDAAASAQLASNTLSLLEGAELLARVQKSTLPLQHAARALRDLAAAALSARSS
jgi:ribosomal protein L4